MTQVIFKTSNGSIAIGDNLQSHFIAEIGLNHNGSLELARGLVLEAAKSGATVVKFQKRFPERLAIGEFLDAPFLKCPLFGSTQREVRERLELNLEEYKDLETYTNNLGLVFCASVFDVEALRFLQNLSNPIVKVASHSITNGPLLRAIADTGLPVVCSVGGAEESEIDIAYGILKSNPLVLLHCVSSYPTPDDLVKLDTINYLKEKYRVPVGFSSHEQGIDVSIAAAVLGACMVERHFTYDRAMVGLDHGISLTPSEFADMVIRTRRLEKVRGTKKELFPAELAARNNYHVGLYSTRSIKKGDRFRRDDIECFQPLNSSTEFFTGLEIDTIVGMTASEDISAGHQIARSSVQ